MKIYFIRHGADDDRYRGGWSALGLIESGRRQAEELASFFKANEGRYPVSKIITSDLGRAMETAAPVARVLGVDVLPSPDWRETNNGVLAGMLNVEALEKYPGVFWGSLEMDERYPGGESPAAFYDRIRAVLMNFVEDGHNDLVAVVTHSGVINVIYHIVRDIKWSNKNKSF
ncbi:MAG: histidine phosphatase family protein, partial [Lactobacillales bacterium]|nr:histidine phosphatase family protein [Lactobacillales bacterium]